MKQKGQEEKYRTHFTFDSGKWNHWTLTQYLITQIGTPPPAFRFREIELNTYYLLTSDDRWQHNCVSPLQIVVSRPWNQLIDTVWNRQYIPGDEKLVKTIEIFQLIFKLVRTRPSTIEQKRKKNSPCEDIITQLVNCCLQTNELVFA
jgi:hypothetical protein